MTDTTTYERQPKESSPAWEAFLLYRNQEPGKRSIRRVAEELRKSEGLCERWSRVHHWVARTRDYDIEQDRQWQESLAGQRRKMAERQIRTASLAQMKVAQWIATLNPDDLTAAEAARWYDVAVKVERDAAGMGARVELSGRDGGPIQVEGLTPEEIRQRLALVQAEIAEALGTDDPEPR